MKTKILLTSALALAISVPAMAADPTPTQTTVTSTSSCTETTLGTATGSVDIEADWQANTINLTWNANNGTVSGGPKQCTYDGTFTLPTSITRTGYNFTGWKVVQAACFISDSDVANEGTAFGSIALSGKSTNDHYEGGATASTYGLTQPGDWGLTLASGGKVTGKAVCTTSEPVDILYVWDVIIGEKDFDITEATATMGAEKAGILQQVFSLMETDEAAAGNLLYGKLLMADTAPSSTGGGEAKYCYCGASSYTSRTGETCPVASRWVFDLYDAYESASDCASFCAIRCGALTMTYSWLRAVLFGSVAQ